MNTKAKTISHHLKISSFQKAHQINKKTTRAKGNAIQHSSTRSTNEPLVAITVRQWPRRNYLEAPKLLVPLELRVLAFTVEPGPPNPLLPRAVEPEPPAAAVVVNVVDLAVEAERGARAGDGLGIGVPSGESIGGRRGPGRAAPREAGEAGGVGARRRRRRRRSEEESAGAGAGGDGGGGKWMEKKMASHLFSVAVQHHAPLAAIWITFFSIFLFFRV